MSFILNIAFVGLLIPITRESPLASLLALLIITFFSLQVKVKNTSQLINGIYSVLQKLLRYFNGTTLLTSSLFTLLPSNFPVILVLYSKDLEFLME